MRYFAIPETSRSILLALARNNSHDEQTAGPWVNLRLGIFQIPDGKSTFSALRNDVFKRARRQTVSMSDSGDKRRDGTTGMT